MSILMRDGKKGALYGIEGYQLVRTYYQLTLQSPCSSHLLPRRQTRAPARRNGMILSLKRDLNRKFSLDTSLSVRKGYEEILSPTRYRAYIPTSPQLLFSGALSRLTSSEAIRSSASKTLPPLRAGAKNSLFSKSDNFAKDDFMPKAYSPQRANAQKSANPR